MHKLIEKLNDNIVCGACGENFSCGAKSSHCWCFDIKLREEILSNLRDNYRGCLCKDCLLKENYPRENAD